MVRVSAPDDPRLHDYVGLTDVVLRMRSEPQQGLFIAEGLPVVERALHAGYAIRSTLVSERYVDQVLTLLDGDDAADLYTAAPDVLREVAGFHVHRGVLASFARKPLPSVAEVAAAAQRVVVLEDASNPTNVGAVFRSAAALGIDAMLLSPRCADPLYRRSVRVSMGVVFALPYARFDEWPRGLDLLRDQGFRILALTPAQTARTLDTLHLARDERVGLLLGAEGPGLTPAALAAADEHVRIPMRTDVDSLNLAAAAAVACWVTGRR